MCECYRHGHSNNVIPDINGDGVGDEYDKALQQAGISVDNFQEIYEGDLGITPPGEEQSYTGEEGINTIYDNYFTEYGFNFEVGQ